MIGSTVSHYRIVDELGQGGMGIVYKAEDLRLDRTVALKFLPRDMTRDPVAKTRFVHEAKAASALDHPNICTVYEIGDTDDGQMYIAMAYYDGQSLRDLIDETPVSIQTGLDFAVQLANGLTKAHEAEIVHRDIKPANVMVTMDGVVKIVDFGLAKVAEQTHVTQEGSTIGTAAYMSPEQARGEDVDARSDQWSLGAVMFEMFAGRRAFKGDYSQAIIYSILNEDPPRVRDLNPEIPPELDRVIMRALEKEPSSRFESVNELASELQVLLDRERGIAAGGVDLRSILRLARSPRVLVPAVIVVVALIAGGVWYSGRQAAVRHAREVILPRIDTLMETSWSDFIDVYRLAEEAEQVIPNDPHLVEIIAQSTRAIDVTTDPPGAEVRVKPYANPDEEWRFLGVTPLEDVRLPVGVLRWKLEKEGYETVLAAETTWDVDVFQDDIIIGNDFHRTLDRAGSLSEGMVRVAGMQLPDGTSIGDFFIDRTEVTNARFKEFIDAGGYRTHEYWQHSFTRDGEVLDWDEAMAEFVDQTGRPGPSTWQAGSYAEGQAEWPVSGVSWYEAAAFAVWAGKSLPTSTHWGRARGEGTPLINVPQLGGFATFAPFSNFGRTGPVQVASLPGYMVSGAYDMAGNVREWCWNETPRGRLVRGGAWSDNTYASGGLRQAPAFDRSERNGFRLALVPDAEQLPEGLFGPLPLSQPADFSSVAPVSDEVFAAYRAQFDYDPTPLRSEVESTDDSGQGWTHERVSFDAAYGNERVIAHLFLPQNAAPPYQTVVYFPGSASVVQTSSEHIEQYYEFPLFLSFLVKNGRAVVYPVFKGTFERHEPRYRPLHMGNESIAYTEYVVQLVKDFKRSVDYLESRDDIDPSRIAYYGMSWGGVFGGIVPAVEDRVRTTILTGAILHGRGRPEVNQVSYLPRITMPVLMLGGEYDTISSVESSQRPMFQLLGTPDGQKELKLYPTDHVPPVNDFVRETLDWLDRYLGPVETVQAEAHE